MQWMILPLKRYAQFDGRSRPTEFWMFFVLQLLLYIALTIFSVLIGAGVAGLSSATSDLSSGPMGLIATMGIFFLLYGVVYLAFLVPNLAVSARRLHDTGKSGWWQLVYWVPWALTLVLTVMSMGDPTGGLAAVTMIMNLLQFVALLALIILYCLPGNMGPNHYGPDPKAAERAAMGQPATY